MFPILKQRQMRWARFDPMASLAIIRPSHDLPSLPNGRHPDLGETVRQKTWNNQVGPYYFTGPLTGYSNRNPIEDQIDWLSKQAPDYLICQAAELEHLALAAQARNQPLSFRGLLAIAQDLTPEMRARVEHLFSGPVAENYGLNEVGIVATHCREGDRYHVNVEHCLVEIVDDSGQPVAPGDTGHLLVTAFNNPAMPLLRYDSGDIAEAIHGPCPCGRSLPAFGRIIGRYRRLAALPEGAYALFNVLKRSLVTMPPDLARPLRQYQIHHFRDGSYELRLVMAAPLEPDFKSKILEDWKSSGTGTRPALTIRQVDEIPRAAGSKFQDFTSDFMT
jgi:phenylacetate-CoA ligase